MLVARTMSVHDWIEAARVLPVEGLELHTGFFWEDTRAELDRVGEALARASFEMPMLCASPDFTHPDAGERAREFDRQVRAVEIAAHLGGDAPTCRVLSGQAHPAVSREQGLDWAADAIVRLLPVAAQLGVTLCLENHYKASTWAYPEFAQRREVFLALLDRVGEHEWFGVQYDPSNALVAGDDPVDLLRAVVERVRTVQASDRHLASGAPLESLRRSDGTIGYSPDLVHGVVGAGLNDYEGIFEVLAGAGYDGWISIEDGVDGMAEMAASARFLAGARDRWFGGSREVRVEARERRRAGAGGAG
ncbi:TIM barrel protein [Kineococcus sp. R8]|nr:TIM barrel protein [Kineococcus siccus]